MRVNKIFRITAGGITFLTYESFMGVSLKLVKVFPYMKFISFLQIVKTSYSLLTVLMNQRFQKFG